MIPGTLESFIQHYGYLAILAGTFLEGETVLVLAGFLAHRGYLDLPGVWLAAFAGTFCSDQLCFYLGRSRGAEFIRRRPAWQAKSRRVFDLLHRHQVWVILGFRFVYGFRIVTPLVIGAARVAPLRFLALNALGAALWAVSLGALGYLIGPSIEMVMGEIRRYEMRVLAGIAVIGAGVWAIYLYRRVVKRADGSSN
ncbi:MAG: DedA family protein [Gammaproteobacteria bacterium]|nr:DedA family protein [Gammaproteobacteria bacterium]